MKGIDKANELIKRLTELHDEIKTADNAKISQITGEAAKINGALRINLNKAWIEMTDAISIRRSQIHREGFMDMKHVLGAEGPVAEGPVAEGPVAEGPVAEGPVAEGPVAEGPVAEEPKKTVKRKTKRSDK